MRRAGIALVLACLAWPSLAMAALSDIEIPAVGMKLVGIPSEIENPTVNRMPDGYAALFVLGPAALQLHREDTPVPDGQTVESAGFQAARRADYEAKGSSIAGASLAKLADHDALVISGTRPSDGLNVWFVDALLIVDARVARVSASAVGAGQRPPEFEKVVALMNSVRFIPVVLPSASDAEPGALPKFDGGKADVYSAVAKRKNLRGIVVVTFSIDAEGRAQNVKETYADHRDLGRSVPDFLRRGRFSVPPTWTAEDAKRLYRIEFHFGLRLPDGSGCPELPQREPGATVIKVCATSLKR